MFLLSIIFFINFFIIYLTFNQEKVNSYTQLYYLQYYSSFIYNVFIFLTFNHENKKSLNLFCSFQDRQQSSFTKIQLYRKPNHLN